MVHSTYRLLYILYIEDSIWKLHPKLQKAVRNGLVFLLSLANYSKKRSGQNGPLTNTSKDKVWYSNHAQNEILKYSV